MTRTSRVHWTLLLGLMAACGGDSEGSVDADAEAVALAGDWDPRIAPEELERGRQDPSWQQVVQLDTAGITPGTVDNPETWEQIAATAVNTAPMQVPIYRDSEGPSVLRVQILLDRVLFSPGVIDGRWGKNTEKAVYWFQQREGLRRTGWVDQATFDRLVEVSGAGTELVSAYTVTAEDVEGPFVNIPDDIYAKAELDCMCYESVEEKLAELFHTTPELLAQLNPGISFDSISAGTTIEVPAIRSREAGRTAQVAKIVVSAQGFYVHALDAAGKIVYHFPTTLGSTFDPSPTGDHRIVKITREPWWHYQPAILAHVPDDEPEARIPAGPNNAVGMVWMALSIPHYGIHGTSAPETIGYTTSAGCVRLTNWDALFLAERIAPGVPVEFSSRPDPSPVGEG